ncbi:GlsB [Streptococcus pneumoniae]|nr:GlsB [Streptococcus pneumoniae]
MGIIANVFAGLVGAYAGQSLFYFNIKKSISLIITII